MTDNELRTLFLHFFQDKGHHIIPSSSLIPHNDPTLLLTTAGMVQCKPYFLGQTKPPHARLASCQKCFRTTDIESVGDASHLTFFEMLGNFSVGDYFKADAIAFAWEFVTQKLSLPAEKLWITVYHNDSEAGHLWLEQGIPAERIIPLGEADNFWGPAGDSGPCGPCSEIHYDFGADVGCRETSCNPSCKCGRFCEIWNLVFMQYSQDKTGKRTNLPRPNIDTGMGLERITAIMQGVNTVYNTSIFRPLIAHVAMLSNQKYGQNEESDRAMRVVAEHGRAVAFLIADGVMPSNEGRGYVLRRLLRRAVLFGRRLGLGSAFLGEMVKVAIKHNGQNYPELFSRQDIILDVVCREEERFAETLNTGLELLDEIMSQEETKQQKMITGKDAFKLYDTYGFPVEITQEIAVSQGYRVDTTGFATEMDGQRQKARDAHKFGSESEINLSGDFAPTLFVGYNDLSVNTRIVGIILGAEGVDEICAKQKAGLILEESPFYAEMGGQVGDVGVISTKEAVFEVFNTTKISSNITLHQGNLESGKMLTGDNVTASVDFKRRGDTERNHTATHLLHSALRQVLGEHVQQGGSLVEPNRLRFDFSHHSALTKEELNAISEIVNCQIRDNLKVEAHLMPYKEAVASGAMALFGEKYGDEVRVLSVGEPPFSSELCGGTHVRTSGEIGFFEIISETSIGSGMRRIEAVTGREAERLARTSIATLQVLVKLLDATIDSAEEKLQTFIGNCEQETKRAEELEREIALKEVPALLSQAREVGGIKLLSAHVKPVRVETLRDMADALSEALGSAVIVLGTVLEEKPFFVVAVTSDLVAKGFHAGNLIRQIAAVTGGGGGGKPGMAQGGGKDCSKLDEAIALAERFLVPR
ncbi:MAG: alanine--tRNA ligase [Dehalococcoidia bacterium]|nr:alanine--tRNA ligase [Dehalococcoidia bacterium]